MGKWNNEGKLFSKANMDSERLIKSGSSFIPYSSDFVKRA